VTVLYLKEALERQLSRMMDSPRRITLTDGLECDQNVNIHRNCLNKVPRISSSKFAKAPQQRRPSAVSSYPLVLCLRSSASSRRTANKYLLKEILSWTRCLCSRTVVRQCSQIPNSSRQFQDPRCILMPAFKTKIHILRSPTVIDHGPTWITPGWPLLGIE
jgi:hypothetical protein